jgi:hypothetical protein
MKPSRALLKLGLLVAVASGSGCVSGRPALSKASVNKHPTDRAARLPVPADMREQVHNSEIIGRQLYVLDKVSAIATDVLAAKVPDFRHKNLGGYLPLQEAGDDLRPKSSYVVSFFTRDKPVRIAYEIRVQPDVKPELTTYDPPKPALSSFAWMAKARQAAIEALPATPQPLNPVILPAALLGETGAMVYLIAGTAKPNTAVFGQHFRVRFAEGSCTPSYVMPLSKTILEVPINPPNGGDAEALIVTHLVTEWPLETHVFVSLLTRKPVYVGTSAGLWAVEGDKISFVGEKPHK